jgi:trigger factor
MLVKVISSEGLSHKLEVTIPAEDLRGKIDARLLEYGKTAVMHGFRKGKIPPKILKQRFGKSIRNEIVQATVFETFQRALQEKCIKPAMRPNIELKNSELDADLIYEISVESMPDLEIVELKGIELVKPVARPSAEEIEIGLRNIAENLSVTQAVAVTREAKDGDILVVDYKGRTVDDGEVKEVQGLEGKHLKLGCGQFVPEFDAQLLGKKTGDSAEIQVHFPEAYMSAELAGRDVLYTVHVREVREPAKKEVNDELAQSLGMSNVDALKDAVASRLQEEWEELSQAVLKRKVLDYLDEENLFDVPEGMLEIVDIEFNNIIKQVESELQREPGASSLSSEEKDEYRKIAERRVRLGLIIAEIGNSENLIVTEADLRHAVEAETRKYPGQEEEVLNYYTSNRSALESLHATALEEKVINNVIKNASVTESTVSYAELLRAVAPEDDISSPSETQSGKFNSTLKKVP